MEISDQEQKIVSKIKNYIFENEDPFCLEKVRKMTLENTENIIITKYINFPDRYVQDLFDEKLNLPSKLNHCIVKKIDFDIKAFNYYNLTIVLEDPVTGFSYKICYITFFCGYVIKHNDKIYKTIDTFTGRYSRTEKENDVVSQIETKNLYDVEKAYSALLEINSDDDEENIVLRALRHVSDDVRTQTYLSFLQ